MLPLHTLLLLGLDWLGTVMQTGLADWAVSQLVGLFTFLLVVLLHGLHISKARLHIRQLKLK